MMQLAIGLSSPLSSSSQTRLTKYLNYWVGGMESKAGQGRTLKEQGDRGCVPVFSVFFQPNLPTLV